MTLPVELVRLVIESAAEISTPTAWNLLVVSSSTRKWVEPILFHTILVKTPHQLFCLKRCLENENTKHCALYVRRLRLMLKGDASTEGLHTVTGLCEMVRQICPHLEHLAFACPSSPNVSSAYLDAIEKRVKLVSIFWVSVAHFRVPLQFPFHQLSHLHVICPTAAFFRLLGRCGESLPSNIQSLVIDIQESQFVRSANTVSDGPAKAANKSSESGSQ